MSQTPEILEGGNRYWKFSPGASARHWEAFYQEGIMALSYDSYAFGDLHAFKDAASLTQSQGLSPHSPVARSLMAFRDAAIGDVVIAHQGRSQAIGVGIITGPYIYQGHRSHNRHTRTVDWVVYQSVPIRQSVFPPDSFAPFRHWNTVRESYLTHFPELKAILMEVEHTDDSPDVSADDENSEAYSRDDALKQVFLEAEAFDALLEALKYKQNIVLQGPPGVGKTFLARQLAQCLVGQKDSSQIEMVQFHPSYAYEDFIQGIRPQAEGNFSLTPGIFYRFCQKAQRNPDRQYVFIIDEINRGHLSKIFGEVMLLLESDKRGPQHAIPLTYSRALSERFYIPQNLYLIGTMNTADRSPRPGGLCFASTFCLHQSATSVGKEIPAAPQASGHQSGAEQAVDTAHTGLESSHCSGPGHWGRVLW